MKKYPQILSKTVITQIRLAETKGKSKANYENKRFTALSQNFNRIKFGITPNKPNKPKGGVLSPSGFTANLFWENFINY